MDVKRESVVGGDTVRTAASSAGTVTVATVSEVDGKTLQLFRELHVRMEVTRAMTGTTPKLDVYLQRAVRPDPDPTDDNDWEDWLTFPQLTTVVFDRITMAPAALPAVTSSNDMELDDPSRVRAVETLDANRLIAGHWGDRLRIREVVTGTITQAAQYHIHMTGM